MTGIRADFVRSLKSYALEKGVDLKVKNKTFRHTQHKTNVYPYFEYKSKSKETGEFVRVFLSKHSKNRVVNLFNKAIGIKTDIKNPKIAEETYFNMALGLKIKRTIDSFEKGTLQPNRIKTRSREHIYVDPLVY